jgi:hypothetical protein
MQTYIHFCTHFECHLLQIYWKEYFEQSCTLKIAHTVCSTNVYIILIFFEVKTHGRKTLNLLRHIQIYIPQLASLITDTKVRGFKVGNFFPLK